MLIDSLYCHQCTQHGHNSHILREIKVIKSLGFGDIANKYVILRLGHLANGIGLIWLILHAWTNINCILYIYVSIDNMVTWTLLFKYTSYNHNVCLGQ